MVQKNIVGTGRAAGEEQTLTNVHKSLAEQLQAATERLYSAAKNYKVRTNASHQQKLQLKRSCWQEEVPVS